MTTTPLPPAGVRDRNGATDAPPRRNAAPTTSLTPTLGALLRRGRTWIVVAAALLAGSLVLLLVQGGIRAPGPQLGASNAGPQGAQALVEVLRDHGVDVAEARSYDAALEQAKAGATVLLFDEFALLDDTRRSRLAMFADRLVVVEPDFRTLEALAPGVRLAGAGSGTIDDVACGLRPAERAGSLSDGQRLFTIDDDAREDGWQGCFRDGDFGFAVAAGPVQGGGDLTLVGSTTVFTNERIDEEGNAALAIGLLGASDSLVWYLPGPADADPSAAPSLAELTPGWVSPVMVLAIAVTIAAAIWRGRRFGPLVVEHLPVDVPAGETAEGRARLYARSAARGHALDQLRIGTLTRLASILKLPRSAHVDSIANAAADATGRDSTSVVRLLIDAHPDDDRSLVDLAAALDELEQHVAASLRPGAAAFGRGGATTDPTDPNVPTDPRGRRP